MHKRKQALPTTIGPWLVTIPEAAGMLRVGRSKVYELIATEGLPKVKFGTAVRIPVKELEEWLAAWRRRNNAWLIIRMSGCKTLR